VTALARPLVSQSIEAVDLRADPTDVHAQRG